MADLKLVDDAEPEQHSFDYDLIVIGGGSGGLACAKEAARFGVKTAVLDFVKESPQGTTWGLGGTCVNVGCIPKKLMHTAALVGGSLTDAPLFGWRDVEKKHSWETLVQNVTSHIKSLNWGYRTMLRSSQVEYVNGLAKFRDAHTIEATMKNGTTRMMTARRFVVAVGGRPQYPTDIPGAKEYAITSDDIFQLQREPGKTLIVGASYVALECAGFLAELGFETSVMVRSILLRGFDQQIADMIGNYMAEHSHVRFIRPAVPSKIERSADGRLAVSFSLEGVEQREEFDTVMFATGRYADTAALLPDAAGLVVEPNGKFRVTNEQTNVPHIYAIGDVVHGQWELTPVAIQAGKLLAARLYGGSTRLMDYINVPTTVFTPLEYGSCGLTEEEADRTLGAENVEVYSTFFKPTEWTVAHRPDNTCFLKLIVDQSRDEKIVGFHVLGIHAGEITQGVAIAMRAGATKRHFDDTIGIHPTSAEAMTSLTISRSSGQSPVQKGC